MTTLPSDVGDEQRRLILRVVGDLESDRRVEGAWLIGSLAHQLGDRFSDVDLLIAVPESALHGLVDEWPGRAASLVDLAFVRRVPSSSAGTTFTHVTAGYVRFDVTFATLSLAVERLPEGISLLGAGPTVRHPAESDNSSGPIAGRVQRLTEEFLRVLGLLPVVIGRHEYLIAASGAALLRSMLIDLYREVGPRGYRGGAMRLERVLSADQLEILRGLPPLLWTRDAAIDLHLACAAHFLPAARQAYDDLGLPWPQAFENAVRSQLRRELDLTLGDDL